MVLDAVAKRIYVIGGQRGDRSMTNMFASLPITTTTILNIFLQIYI